MSQKELSRTPSVKQLHRISYVLGIGLALFPLHWANQPFVDYIFLPQLGTMLVVGAVTLFALHQVNTGCRTYMGDKRVWIPMLIIVASMMLPVAVRPGKESMAVGMFGICLFGTYVVAYNLAKMGLIDGIKRPIIMTAGAVAVGGVTTGLLNPGSQDGGIITNYCAAVGFLVIGSLLINRKWLWLALAPTLLAAFVIGALEGVFVIGMMLAIVLIRQDWGLRMLLPVGVVILVVIIATASGKIGELYQASAKNIQAITSIVTGQTRQYGSGSNAVDAALTGRWDVVVSAMKDIQILGHGYKLTPAPDAELGEQSDRRPVHNTPLHITDQIGPMAGIAWLWVSVFCLVKTRWKYFWAAVLVTSILDYYIWTQFAPWWWVLAGASIADKSNSSDLIFKVAKA